VAERHLLSKKVLPGFERPSPVSQLLTAGVVLSGIAGLRGHRTGLDLSKRPQFSDHLA
jgi:hypothetical protein